MIEHAEYIAAALCRRFEGFYSLPYLCPAGVPTIGFGFTYYLDGTPVTLRDPAMSRAEAERTLIEIIRREFMVKTMRLCPNANTPERLGMLTDFVFNLGPSALRSSTLRKKIEAGLWDEVPYQLRRWTKAGGRVLRGLVLRREAEIQYV